VQILIVEIEPSSLDFLESGSEIKAEEWETGLADVKLMAGRLRSFSFGMPYMSKRQEASLRDGLEDDERKVDVDRLYKFLRLWLSGTRLEVVRIELAILAHTAPHVQASILGRLLTEDHWPRIQALHICNGALTLDDMATFLEQMDWHSSGHGNELGPAMFSLVAVNLVTGDWKDALDLLRQHAPPGCDWVVLRPKGERATHEGGRSLFGRDHRIWGAEFRMAGIKSEDSKAELYIRGCIFGAVLRRILSRGRGNWAARSRRVTVWWSEEAM
jgi:hypothetical protein